MAICLFPARVGTSTFDAILIDRTFPDLYFDLACKQLCFPPGKSIKKRNESTTSELCRAFSELFKSIFHNLSRAFQNFFETLKNCIEPSSERVYNYY